MNIPDDILLFTGYNFGHAAYSVCDLEEPETLIPFVLYEHEGKQTINRFEAETQEEEIDAANEFILEHIDSYSLLSFAREGTMRDESGEGIDVLCIKTWSKTCEAPVSVIQAFTPFYKNQSFSLIDEMILQINDQELDDPSGLIQIVKEGISMHQAAGPLYATWRV